LRYLILIIFLFNASSCQYIKSKFERKDDAIARAYDKYLFAEDVAGIVPKGTQAKDSIDIVHSYINNWIRQQVLLKQAENNTNYNEEMINAQLESYRNALIIYSYEQQLVAQKLDTVVTDEQIENYYALNKSNFELKKSIVKASYAKIPLSAHTIDNAVKWFRSDKEKDRIELETYCTQFATIYSLSDTNWFYLEHLVNVIPLSRYSESYILQKTNYIEFKPVR